MKIFIFAVIIIFVPSFVFSTPFLVCDSYPTTVEQPDYFNVTMDGVTVQSIPEVLTGGSVRLHYDLSGISTGAHNSSVSACNEWGCSSTVPFGFSKTVPGAPANIRLSNN